MALTSLMTFETRARLWRIRSSEHPGLLARAAVVWQRAIRNLTAPTPGRARCRWAPGCWQLRLPKPVTVSLVDLTPEMLEQAPLRDSPSRRHVVRGDAMNLPSRPGSSTSPSAGTCSGRCLIQRKRSLNGSASPGPTAGSSGSTLPGPDDAHQPLLTWARQTALARRLRRSCAAARKACCRYDASLDGELHSRLTSVRPIVECFAILASQMSCQIRAGSCPGTASWRCGLESATTPPGSRLPRSYRHASWARQPRDFFTNPWRSNDRPRCGRGRVGRRRRRGREGTRRSGSISGRS